VVAIGAGIVTRNYPAKFARGCSNTTSYNKTWIAEILAKIGHSPLASFALRLRETAGEVSAVPTGGASMLTAREREVMLLAGEGLSNTKIAGRLGISDKTVAVHLQHIYRKLGIRNRTMLPTPRAFLVTPESAM